MTVGNLLGNFWEKPAAGQPDFPAFPPPPVGGWETGKGSPGNFPLHLEVGKREVGNFGHGDRVVCTRCGMEGHRASQCKKGIFRSPERCTRCQVGQVRNCSCGKPFRMSDADLMLLIWVGDLGIVALTGWMVWRFWA